MPPSLTGADAAAAVRRHVAAVAALLEPHAAWAAESVAWPAQLARLLAALEELAASQAAFALVDAARPFGWRAARLLAWLATDAGFT